MGNRKDAGKPGRDVMERTHMRIMKAFGIRQ